MRGAAAGQVWQFDSDEELTWHVTRIISTSSVMFSSNRIMSLFAAYRFMWDECADVFFSAVLVGVIPTSCFHFYLTPVFEGHVGSGLEVCGFCPRCQMLIDAAT